MRPKLKLATAILSVALLAAPAFAANQQRPQAAAFRPVAPSFHTAPAPVFRPPHPVAAPPRVAAHQPPMRDFQPPVNNFRPQQPIHQSPPHRGPIFAVNQPVQKLPPFHLPGKPVNRNTPRAASRPPLSVPPSSGRGFVPPTRWAEPQPGVICDGDGDNCRPASYGYPPYGYYPPAPPVVCDGDGDDCAPAVYGYQPYPYTPPIYNYQPGYVPYYSHPEPDADDFDSYYLPYQAPPIVCDEDGDDCGPAPFYNEAYRAWAPLQPIPVALSLSPAYYADANLYRLRGRLITMDQAARARYALAVQHQQMQQARHLFHETRSLDAQLTRLDSQAYRATVARRR